MDINLHQLRMLREVANRRTIAAAADSLGYTSSAVSQQLAGLERATGVAVLERVGRNVRLTDAGRELVRHANDLLAGMEAAQVAVERVNSEVGGTLELAVYESVAGTLLSPLIARLGERHPDLRLRTRQVDPDLAIESLVMGDIDVAFTIDYPHLPAPRRDDITYFALLEDRIRAVVPPDDPLSGPTVALADLAGRPFISSSPSMSCGRCVVRACRDAGFEPDLVHQLDDYSATMHLVAAGEGVALVPDLALIGRREGSRVLDIEPVISRTVQLAYRTTSAERPSILAVRDTLVELIRELGMAAP